MSGINFSSYRLSLPLLLALHCSVASAQSTITVSGKSNPWLATFPDGTTSSTCDGISDKAPAQSPSPVLGIPIFPGQQLAFTASGKVSHDSSDLIPLNPPDGNAAVMINHRSGSEHGIADILAPIDALIGVFLGPDSPTSTLAPAALNFSTISSRDFLKLTPSLKQPFFIGDGLAASQVQQMIVAPQGATRLFLGVMDECGWWSNRGSFTAKISQFAPVVTVAFLGNSQVEICWSTFQNLSYQLQSRKDFTVEPWQNLGQPILGNGGQNCFQDSTGVDLQKVYQVVIP